MTEHSIKTESESKCVLELYDDCSRGLYPSIKKVLEDKDFSSKTLDTAIRRCMRNNKRERREYYDCMSLLLQYVDVNYKNQNEESSTILMVACNRGDLPLVELIIGTDYTYHQNFPNQKVDFSARESNNKNFLHYLVNKENQEEDALEIVELITNSHNVSLNLNVDIPEIIDSEEPQAISKHSRSVNYDRDNLGNNTYTLLNITNELNIDDKDGFTPLAYAVLGGWLKLSKKFIKSRAKTNIRIASNNNLIHLAVYGANLNCLKLILKESSYDDFKQRNKDGLTPSELARKKDLNYFSKIIDNYEENYNNPLFINLFGEKNSINLNDILEKLSQEDYTETLFLLNQLELNQSIRSSNVKNQNLKWNKFLAEYHMKLKNFPKSENRIEKKFEISPESILSKFIEKKTESTHKKSTAFSEFKNFFDQIKCNDQIIDGEFPKIDIIIFNKGMFYYKMGDYVNTIRIFLDYLKYILNQNDSNYYKWIIYVNVSFILIELFIFLKYTKFVNCIIEQMEEFLFTNFRLKKDDTFTADMINIVNYLNDREVIQKFTPTWDESFCLMNLYKAMKNIFDVKLDEAKIYLKDFKKLFRNCIYKEDLKIFKTLYKFYHCLKIKMFYYENSFTKCFKKLNKIYQITKIEQINITVNTKKIDERFNQNEYILYYLNTIGIITLKQKKFYIAEIFFKSCIAHYKKVYLMIERKEENFAIKLDYIFYIKYNLALCYFFLKKYEKAHGIFKELLKNRVMKTNIFIWYRLGLCYLEIELAEVKILKKSKCRNDLIYGVTGYTPSVLTTNNEKHQDENDEYLMDDGAVNLNFIDDDDPPAPTNVKRILMLNNSSTVVSKKRIAEAIRCFKQVLLLSKPNINSNSKLNEKSEMKEIYDFYFDKKSAYIDKNDDEDIEKTASKIKSLPQLIVSTYLNLIFCLCLTENWTEILFYCNQFEKSEYYKKDKDLIYKIDNFRIQAYINLKLVDKALEITKSNFISLNLGNNEFKGYFYNCNNNTTYSDVSYKLALNVNLAKLHYLNNNISEGDKCLDNILYNNPNQLHIPPFVLNLMIYSNLCKGNDASALNLIKYRRIGPITNFKTIK